MSIIYASSLGAFVAGIWSALKFFAPSLKPLWADYAPLETYVPMLQCSASALSLYFGLTLMLLLLYIITYKITNQWQTNKIVGLLVIFFFGFFFVGTESIDSISYWLASGTIFGLILAGLFNFFIRFDYALITIITGVFVIISKTMQQAVFNAFPGALISNIVAVLCIVIFSYWWYRQLNR